MQNQLVGSLAALGACIVLAGCPLSSSLEGGGGNGTTTGGLIDVNLNPNGTTGTTTGGGTGSTTGGTTGGSTGSTACTSLSSQVGQTCTLQAGGQGVYNCAAGSLVCQECVPGATRQSNCTNCGLTTYDTCSATGTWQVGACDTCGAPPSGSACGKPSGCMPGATEYRRCDGQAIGCQNGTDCGANWACNDSCQWAQQGNCIDVPSPQCHGDQAQTINCGYCGSVQETCEATASPWFWVHVDCQNSGLCNPGESHQTPCESPVPSDNNSCTAGYSQWVTCANNCQWGTPSSCTTACNVGANNTLVVPCSTVNAAVDANMCTGQASIIQTCVTQSVQTCGGAFVEQTTWQNSDPNIAGCGVGGCGGGSASGGGCMTPCTPGNTQSTTCSTSCGLGTAVQTCNPDACTWSTGACTINGEVSCMPGAVSNSNTQTCGAICPTEPLPLLCNSQCNWQPTTGCAPCE